MDDAEFERQKARLLHLVDRWIEPLGLRWWRIDVVYCRDEFEVDGAPARDTMASCKANWRYLQATVTWNMPRVRDEDDDEVLERSFVHECMHVFLNEMRETNNDDWLSHEERVASMLTSAFLWVRQAAEPVHLQTDGTVAAASALNGLMASAQEPWH